MRVLYVEDDPYDAGPYIAAMRARGIDVVYCMRAGAALKLLDDDREFDAAVLDIRMPRARGYTMMETAGGYRTGLEAYVNHWYCSKKLFDEERFADFVQDIIWRESVTIRPFIVHGHDSLSQLQLKNFLQNNISTEQPIILSEKPSKGLTVIEWFEKYAREANVVFALFTPDDRMENGAAYARPNVLFEFGYFVGRLGRGRVFILFKQGVSLPSDLHGIVYIDVTNGVEAAGERIRRELSALF